MENVKVEAKELKEKLFYKKKNIFSNGENDAVFAFAEDYKIYLDNSKTERDAVITSVELSKKEGYTEYSLGDNINEGDKKYFVNHKKSFVAFKKGKKGAPVKILASHIDSPRLDVKQNPLYEEEGMAYLKTHYYGGIKKYQWTAVPLALHGVICLNDGSEVNICIGEDEKDPVFYITDILPHLAREQAEKSLAKAIPAESLNVIVGGLPYDEESSDAIKLGVMKILNDAYGIVEEDFLSAELCLVPAEKARDVGFDRAFISAYGHDDKVCSYPALRALYEYEGDETVVVILADKEEIGSEGNTGMQCAVFTDILEEIAKADGISYAILRQNAQCLSADVTAGYDPNFASVFEKRNSALISCGVAMSKFTGAGGKSSSNDASAEYVSKVRAKFAKANVVWQAAELGKTDAGGGGTVAKYIAKLNIDTVDLGVPVLSMHAPYEVISKADLYSCYEAFKAFIK